MHALRLIWNKVSTTHTEANGKWIGTLDPLIEPLTSFAIATTKKRTQRIHISSATSIIKIVQIMLPVKINLTVTIPY